MQRYRGLVSDGAVWPNLIVVSTPSLHFLPCVVKTHKPVRVQTFGSELAVEAFNEGGIVAFFRRELPKKVGIEIDETTLNRSHRNCAIICEVSSRLFPAMIASRACDCGRCREQPATFTGFYILPISEYAHYLANVRPMQLRDKINSKGVDHRSPAMNFGESKGRAFDHVVILPTEPMRTWLSDQATELKAQSRAKFYVALTRARHSVAVVMDWRAAPLPSGFSLYERETFA